MYGYLYELLRILLCTTRSSRESATLQTKLLPPTHEGGYKVPLCCSEMAVLNHITRCLGQVTSFTKFAFFFSYYFLHSVSHHLTCLLFISSFSPYIFFISFFTFLLRLFRFNLMYLIKCQKLDISL